MKRILLFIDILNSGGAQRQIVGLAGLLKEKGYGVKIITYFDKNFYSSFLEAMEVEVENVNGGDNYLKRIPLVAKAITSYAPDIVISYLDTPSLITCLLKKLRIIKCPIIVSERNTTQKLTRALRLKFHLLRYADAIVSNSYSQAEYIKEHFPNLTPKLSVITNFVDLEYFAPAEKPNIKNPKSIICVGRISPQKNVLQFLEVISRLVKVFPSVRVDWYGNAMGEYAERCRNLISEKGINDYFAFHEPDPDIRDRYREYSIFCLPSLWEGFPNVLCEAMSCGMPVVCGDVCDNRKIVQGTKNGILFNPSDNDDMFNKISEMLNLPVERREEMGHKSREIAITLFSKETFVKQYINLIKSLC